MDGLFCITDDVLMTNVVNLKVTIVTLTKSVWKTNNNKFDARKAVSQDTDRERRYASMDTWDQE
ncbi:hypothetical protein SOPP22_01830 [Shewanella sp. OPT22]|nr:hypothetical protein SOPP22_01830 [Shewanella sp. OPT22]